MHTIEIFSQTTAVKNLVILAFIGAELAGGGEFCPLPGRVILKLNPIPGRGLSWVFFLFTLHFRLYFQTPRLWYKYYLRDVVVLLKQDPQFKAILANATEEEVQVNVHAGKVDRL